MVSTSSLQLSIGQATDTGLKNDNQDCHGFRVPTGRKLALKGALLAVCDGISSSAVSDQAAQITIDTLMKEYLETPDTWTVKTALGSIISSINTRLYAQNQALDDMNKGLVCTLSAFLLQGAVGHIFHIGDSRIQRFNGRGLEALTRDHSVFLSSEEDYLSKALGIDAGIEPDYDKVPLKAGDVFLLTTDGVHDHIDGPSVQAALEKPSLDDAANALIQVALRNGSKDNLTIQIVRIDAVPDQALINIADDFGTLPLPPTLSKGSVIDGLTIRENIHHTSRSQIFLATTSEGQKLAVKIPASDMTADPKALHRFMLEDWVTRRINSQHVISAPAQADERTALYSLTHFLEGTSLRTWMQENPKPNLETVRQIVEQICSGLRAIHRREILHQDIRPENIMIDQSGHVKIIDLGSASVAGVEEASPGLLGHMPGTYQYTAPEYLSGSMISWRSDQFALGVIVYEMLTGRLPYGQQVARIETPKDQLALKYQSARDETSSLPVWIDQALQKATHPEPLKRYDALSEFMADLTRPSAGWDKADYIPLVERDPVRFWQGVSATLALLCAFLVVQLFG